MRQERVEEYLGAIYRLRAAAETPLALAKLTTYFGFSPVSVHEMIKKLSVQGWVIYHPYHGVTLTAAGESIALALLRRHRLWELFLTDVLHVPWDEAHDIAGKLEHATCEAVTERLAIFLGTPEACPHGAPIPPATKIATDQCLAQFPIDTNGRVTRISPESTELLHLVQQYDLLPGRHFHVIEQTATATIISVPENTFHIPKAKAQAIWAELFSPEAEPKISNS